MLVTFSIKVNSGTHEADNISFLNTIRINKLTKKHVKLH